MLGVCWGVGRWWRAKREEEAGSSLLQWALLKHGQLVAARPRLVILVFLALTALAATGFYNIQIITDINDSWTPYNAPSRREQAGRDEYNSPLSPPPPPTTTPAPVTPFPGDPPPPAPPRPPPPPPPPRPWRSINVRDSSFPCACLAESWAQVMLESSSRLNLLEKPGSELAKKTLEHVRTGLTYHVDGKPYTLQSICESGCGGLTTHINRFFFFWFNEKLHVKGSGAEFTYPVMKISSLRLHIGALLNRVTTNATGWMTHAHIVMSSVGFHTNGSELMQRHWSAYLRALGDFASETNRGSHIRVHLFSDDLATSEMSRMHKAYAPLFVAAVALLALFAVLATTGWTGGETFSMEALCGFTSCLLSIVAAFGLMSHLSVPFHIATVIMPFLVLAIGIDDTFLLIQGWRVREDKCPKRRIALTMRDMGSAITLTTLTDCLSFAIGSVLCETPAFRLFCLYSAVAVLMDFLFQVSLFPALLLKLQEFRSKHNLCSRGSCGGSSKRRLAAAGLLEDVAEELLSLYTQPWFKASVAAVFGAYIVLSFTRITKLRVNLSAKKLFLSDSPLSSFLNLAETTILNEGLPVPFYVLNPPDFVANYTQGTEEVLRLVEELENTTFAVGKASTQNFINDFHDYRHLARFSDDRFYEKLGRWLDQFANRNFVHHLRRHLVNGTRVIGRFKFVTYFAGIGPWPERVRALRELRAVCARYPHLRVYPDMIYSYLADQVDTLGQSTMQTTGTALVAMAAVALVFFPTAKAAFWLFTALLSIATGVIGFVELLGADLDPVIAANIIIAVGFAVDFAGHFCYHLYQPHTPTHPPGKMSKTSGREAVSAVGWPLVQCALSTGLTMVPLLFVDAYITRFFFFSVFLTSGFGLLHALVVLPVLLPPLQDFPRRIR